MPLWQQTQCCPPEAHLAHMPAALSCAVKCMIICHLWRHEARVLRADSSVVDGEGVGGGRPPVHHRAPELRYLWRLPRLPHQWPGAALSPAAHSHFLSHASMRKMHPYSWSSSLKASCNTLCGTVSTLQSCQRAQSSLPCRSALLVASCNTRWAHNVSSSVQCACATCFFDRLHDRRPGAAHPAQLPKSNGSTHV